MAYLLLDYSDKWHLALEYAQKAIELSTTSTHLSTTLKAKIIYQIASYKLGNGKFSKKIIEGALYAFELAEWNAQYNQMLDLVKSHSIDI